jgi:hypothetical protein
MRSTVPQGSDLALVQTVLIDVVQAKKRRNRELKSTGSRRPPQPTVS